MNEHSHLLNAGLQLEVASEVETHSRYDGFANGFFHRLYQVHPSLKGKFRFFRDQATEDVWSVCETPNFEFGVQLDPDIECICIWDETWHDEIGNWVNDPIEFAIGIITQRYVNREGI